MRRRKLSEQRDPARWNRRLAVMVIVLSVVVLLTGGATAYLWWQRPTAEAAGPGGQVALVAGDLQDNLDLWLADPAGNNRRRLTNTPENEVYPTWSPDGSKLAFVRLVGLDQSGPQREWGENEGLYWLRFEGEKPVEEQLLLASEGGIGVPSWSPDGRHLLVVAPVDPADSEALESRVTLIDVATKQRQSKTLPFGVGNVQPSWSPHDGAVAVVGLGKDEGAERPVSRLHLLRLNQTQVVAEQVDAAAFSPTEPLLASLEEQGERLRLRQPDGTEVATLLDGDHILSFVWSPDGTTLAIARMSAEQFVELVLYRLADDSATVIPLGEQHFPNYMAWSPDGRYLSYTYPDFSQSDSEIALAFVIGIIDVRAGTVMPFATHESVELMASWRPAATEPVGTEPVGTESVSADSASIE